VDELKLLKDIERLIKREIPVVNVPGFDVDPRIRAEPIMNGQNRGQGGRGQGRGQPRAGGAPRTGGKPAGGAGRGGVPAAAQHRSGGRGR